MRERGHTQCHCRRVICKCQSRGMPGEQARREGCTHTERGGERESVKGAAWRRGGKHNGKTANKKVKMCANRKVKNLPIIVRVRLCLYIIVFGTLKQQLQVPYTDFSV